jgi:hypothetical protein
MGVGPNGELNGSDIVLKQKIGSSFVLIGSQRGVRFQEQNDPIDFSSKNQREYRGDYGRYHSTVNLTNLYIPTASGMAALKAAARAGTKVTVQRVELNAALEEADGILTNLSTDAPDQAPAVVTVDLTIDGAWRASS